MNIEKYRQALYRAEVLQELLVEHEKNNDRKFKRRDFARIKLAKFTVRHFTDLIKLAQTGYISMYEANELGRLNITEGESK